MLDGGTFLEPFILKNQVSFLILCECMRNFLIVNQKCLWIVMYKAPGYVPWIRPSLTFELL